MFKVITKEEYWDWLHQHSSLLPGSWLEKLSFPYRLKRLKRVLQVMFTDLIEQQDSLKLVQDIYILHRLANAQGMKLLEVGGGYSRVARVLSKANEYWLVDRYDDRKNRPPSIGRRGHVKFIIDHMGNFNPSIPDYYFDFVFSISVLEHVHLDRLDDFFRDCARVLKPGGRILHVIDSYAFDEIDHHTPQAVAWKQRTCKYLSLSDQPDLGIRFIETPSLCEEPLFSCKYVSLSDEDMYQVQRHAPDLKRSMGQRISFIAEWEKIS